MFNFKNPEETMIDFDLRQEMLRIGKKLYQKDLISASEGNFSVRLDEQRLLATPSGLCKGEMETDDLVVIDVQGNHLQGKRRVSSEILLHLEAYRQRPEVQAVIHAHPPCCIALMLAGKGLDRPVLAENVILLGKIPLAPYARPSTQQVPESIRPYILQTDCILLDHHGSLTLGSSLQEAFFKLEMMEHTAKSYLAALQIGEVKELHPEEVSILTAMREKIYGIRWPVIPFGQ